MTHPWEGSVRRGCLHLEEVVCTWNDGYRVVSASSTDQPGSEQALQCTITAIFSQSRHAALTGASLNTIVEFGLVFLPVLACPCSQLLHIAFNGTSRKKEHVFYGTRNSEVV
jgi:hypothetical protein